MRIEIDDRLPVVKQPDGSYQLRYVKLNDDREFWPALIEKAVAKVLGGYQWLDGGFSVHALEILTGGKVDIFFPGDEDPDDLFRRLTNAYEADCIMTCGIQSDPRSDMNKTGLFDGHAYSLTGVATVALKSGGSVDLLRIRNPWGATTGGRGEWKLKWSDRSSAWKNVAEKEKKKIEFSPEHDGEFWMDVGDFCEQFTTVSICQPRKN